MKDIDWSTTAIPFLGLLYRHCPLLAVIPPLCHRLLSLYCVWGNEIEKVGRIAHPTILCRSQFKNFFR